MVDDVSGEAVAFAIAGPRTLSVRSELMEAQVLTDFVAAAGPDGDEAGRVLLEELGARAAVTFAAGWSHGATAFLRRHSWRHIANWPRFRFAPTAKRRAGAAPLPGGNVVSEDPTPIQSMLTDTARSFFSRPHGLDRQLCQFEYPSQSVTITLGSEKMEERTKGSAYLRLLQAPGAIAGELEWHLADLRLPQQDMPLAAGFLAALANNSGQAVYISVLNHDFQKALVSGGAEFLAARWGLFCRFRDQSFRDLSREFTADAPWYFSPADFELDLER